ncbi:hypothetical protein [Hyphomonas sp.]|uniref:hypothetical protein n=1 Tax=Hyphomonas sp. TaxID=87 RepID=UPI000C3C5BF9|nr:hypothetical protein [Hyphomonas sp.]MAB11856.1 hypothetical protein [Hyphomonas sp.]MAU67923.1 hypothetical protein [Hyphomonas sp.]MBM58983.1 hypothetical protein [Hyphomonas sp.]
MRIKLWAFDTVHVDLEDRDVSVTVVHGITGTEVNIRFRVTPEQLKGPVENLRPKLEHLATHRLLDLSSFLEHPD